MIPPPRYFISPRPPARPRGIALLFVLAFIALLSGVVLALFSRAIVSRQVSNSSCAQAHADDLARSALAILTSSLKQEIVNGSTASTIGNYTLYTATSGSYLLPQSNGSWSAIPNLVRISSPTLASWPAAGETAASNASATGTSANGRSISRARWNQHYLVPRSSSSTATDTNPIASFTAPSWVYVTSRGPVSLVSPTSAAIGRYAYAIYDTSGLLDANVAGYPVSATAAQIGAKGPLAFADLTQLGLSGSNAVNSIVGWRHFITAKASGTWSDFQFSSNSIDTYFAAMFSNANGFLRVSGVTDSDGHTDQAFVTRQELIEMRRCLRFTQNALQYLGTFSRAVTAPSNFCDIRRTNGGFFGHYHDDGSTESVDVSADEPLLRSRFSLGKLVWLTGSCPAGVNAAAIQSCFGLQWDADHARWNYVGSTASTGDAPTSIETLADIAAEVAPREPNFFELLKAGIDTASLGARAEGYSVPADAQIFQIGANMIDQADTDSTPTVLHLSCSVPAGYSGNAERFQTVAGIESTPDDPPRTILNRPFHSAGDLGYVFRDSSYAPLNFSSSTSADTTLLDLFSALDEPYLCAGKINPSQAPATVLKAVLAGTFTTGTSAPLSGVQNLADQISSSLATSPPSDLPGIVPAISSAVAHSNKSTAEAPIRALAPVSNVRTWNLMIDLIAQTGVFTPNATSLDSFVIQSERRYWLHLAIDRLTGKVVDQQLEAVSD